MRRLTLLSGPVWPLSTRTRQWLASQPAYVPIEILDPQCAAAERRFPDLVKAPLTDLVAVSDDGAVWRGPAAWVTALWALRSLRATAIRLATPAQRLRAREVLLTHAAGDARVGPLPPLRAAFASAVWIAAIVAAGLQLGSLVFCFALLLLTIGGFRQLERALVAFAGWALVVLLGLLADASFLVGITVVFAPLALALAFIPARAPEPSPVRGGPRRLASAGGIPPPRRAHESSGVVRKSKSSPSLLETGDR